MSAPFNIHLYELGGKMFTYYLLGSSSSLVFSPVKMSNAISLKVTPLKFPLNAITGDTPWVWVMLRNRDMIVKCYSKKLYPISIIDEGYRFVHCKDSNRVRIFQHGREIHGDIIGVVPNIKRNPIEVLFGRKPSIIFKMLVHSGVLNMGRHNISDGLHRLKARGFITEHERAKAQKSFVEYITSITNKPVVEFRIPYTHDANQTELENIRNSAEFEYNTLLNWDNKQQSMGAGI